MRNSKSRFSYFLLTAILIALSLQILVFIRSQRIDARFDELISHLEKKQNSTKPETTQPEADRDLPMEPYIGDEGDWLIWAFRVEPKTLNVYSVDSDIYTRWILVPYIFEPLLMYDYDTMKLDPWLAESYKISDDALEITFTLRDDIWFSDGVPIAADDVVFTYETVMDPMVDAADMAQSYLDVESCEKLDDRTVRFRMKKPYFKALENCAFTFDRGILPKHIYEYEDAAEFNQRVSNPVGSGPYVFEKWEKGRQVVLRRNENYWGYKPKLEKFIWRFISNDIAAVQALRSGEVDMIIPTQEQYADLVSDESFTEECTCLEYWDPGAPFFYIGWNQMLPFFKDRRVRLAMTHLVDREKIVEHLLKGYSAIVSGPFFPMGEDCDPNIEPWPFDIERAKELLDEAGWVDTDGDGIRDKDGVKFRFKFLYSADSTIYRNIYSLLRNVMRKVGIEIVADPTEWSIIMGKLPQRDFDATIMGWGGDIIEDQFQIFHSSQIGDGASNYVGFRNAQADALMEQIRMTLDKKKRIKLNRRLHRILHEEQPYTFLFARPYFRILDKRFRNVKIHTLGLKYWEWYVPKDEQKY